MIWVKELMELMKKEKKEFEEQLHKFKDIINVK
jgi:hypothetical protein